MATIWWKGDEAEYTGETTVCGGAKLYRVRYLPHPECMKVGMLEWIARSPDAAEQAEQDWKRKEMAGRASHHGVVPQVRW